MGDSFIDFQAVNRGQMCTIGFPAFWKACTGGFEKEYYPENVIIVSHGLTIRLFLMRWLHWRVEYFERLDNPHNCEFFILKRQPTGRFSLITPMRTRDALNASNEENQE